MGTRLGNGSDGGLAALAENVGRGADVDHIDSAQLRLLQTNLEPVDVSRRDQQLGIRQCQHLTLRSDQGRSALLELGQLQNVFTGQRDCIEVTDVVGEQARVVARRARTARASVLTCRTLQGNE